MATIRRKHREPVRPLQRDPGPWSRLVIDWLATLAVIMVFGLVMLFSASYTTGYLRMGDSFHYIKQQALCMMIGLGCMFVMSYMDHRFCANGGAGVFYRAGHAGRYPDHGPAERLPPLDPLRRLHAAVFRGGKI